MMKIVKVDWWDSASLDGWVSVEYAETFAPSKCETIGWIIKKTREYVTLVASKSDTVNYCQLFSIPRKCIISIKELAETP